MFGLLMVKNEIWPCYCTVQSRSLQSLFSWPKEVKSQDQVPLSPPDMPWKSNITRHYHQNIRLNNKCVSFCLKEVRFINYRPVSCHREQISEPLHHCDYTRFLFSRGRCIHLVPAWICASFCQWSSECHSALNQKRKVTWHKGCSWGCAATLLDSSQCHVVLTGSHFPMSPVCSHPSLSIASAVLSGSFRYPWNTFGPLTHT